MRHCHAQWNNMSSLGAAHPPPIPLPAGRGEAGIVVASQEQGTWEVEGVHLTSHFGGGNNSLTAQAGLTHQVVWRCRRLLFVCCGGPAALRNCPLPPMWHPL